jgi:hypothetical protein
MRRAAVRFERGLIVNSSTVLIGFCGGTLFSVAAPSSYPHTYLFKVHFTIVILFTPTSPNCTLYSSHKSGINAAAIDIRYVSLIPWLETSCVPAK